MKLTQLSLFLENKPGHVKIPCQVLAEAGVNICTLSLADTAQFGILHLIVEDWEKGYAALKNAGCVVNTTDVLALVVPDRPGGLADLLDHCDTCGLNIEYMYAFTRRRKQDAIMIICFEDPDKAIEVLKDRKMDGVDVMRCTDLFGDLEGL